MIGNIEKYIKYTFTSVDFFKFILNFPSVNNHDLIQQILELGTERKYKITSFTAVRNK